MSSIQSILNTAVSVAGTIKAKSMGAGNLPSVSEAAQTSVTANSECVSAYSEAVSMFSSYQTVTDRDAMQIEKIANTFDGLDNGIAVNLGSV